MSINPTTILINDLKQQIKDLKQHATSSFEYLNDNLETKKAIRAFCIDCCLNKDIVNCVPCHLHSYKGE